MLRLKFYPAVLKVNWCCMAKRKHIICSYAAEIAEATYCTGSLPTYQRGIVGIVGIV